MKQQEVVINDEQQNVENQNRKEESKTFNKQLEEERDVNQKKKTSSTMKTNGYQSNQQLNSLLVFDKDIKALSSRSFYSKGEQIQTISNEDQCLSESNEQKAIEKLKIQSLEAPKQQKEQDVQQECQQQSKVPSQIILDENQQKISQENKLIPQNQERFQSTAISSQSFTNALNNSINKMKVSNSLSQASSIIEQSKFNSFKNKKQALIKLESVRRINTSQFDTIFQQIVEEEESDKKRKFVKKIFEMICFPYRYKNIQNKKDFIQNKLDNSFFLNIFGIIASFCLNLVLINLMTLSKSFKLEKYLIVIIFQSIWIFFHVVYFIVFLLKKGLILQSFFSTALYSICILLFLFYTDIINAEVGFIICFYSILIAHECNLMLNQILITFLLLITLEIIILKVMIADSHLFFVLLEIILSCKVLLLQSVYVKEKNEINAYKIQKATMEEISKTENLLTHLMPLHVLEQMKQGETVAEELEDVPILFADIVGFTTFASNKQPKEVIEMLSKLFAKFDNLCVSNDCYKVCTIGDCYVAIGYNGSLQKEQRDKNQELKNMMKFSLELIVAIEEVCKECNAKIQLRIGIHVGKIIGGISGSNIVRYDIYGPAVKIANLMESNGQPGFINVSHKTKNLLDQCASVPYSYEFNKKVLIKSQDSDNQDVEISCYFVICESQQK